MSDGEPKPEVESQNKEPEKENPQENQVQPKVPQTNEEEQEPEMNQEEEGQESAEKIKTDAANANAKEEDLFAGPYERLIDRKFIPDPNYSDTKILPTENFNSEIKPKRQFFYNILITRQKREFEAPINNLFQDKNSSEEQTVGNNEVKGVKSANEYPMTERSSIEMGFQTDNVKVTKSFQVAKKVKLNSYTQTEHNLSDIKEEFQKKVNGYLSNQNQLTQIDNFLLRIKPKMEEALQSNETINIFMNDFDLDKFNRIGNEEGIKNTGEQEARTFRDNSAGTKNKKEKCVHWIRSIDNSIPFIAHSLKRNFSFEESLKIVGIPYQSSVLFWNVKDVEQNSPVFEVSTPGEVTCFEFDPDNVNNMVIALSSGQLMFIKFFDEMKQQDRIYNTDMYSYLKKADIKEFYLFNLSSLKWTHQSNITSVKWFPPGYSYKKKGQMQFSPDEHESSIVVSLGEDGIVMIWDFKSLSLHESKYAQVINDVNDYLQPTKKIEVNKVDSIGRIGGTGLEIEDGGEQKFYFYISTDEGQVYCVDMNAKNTADNPTGNVVMHYNNRYFRPVLYFERSPFFNDIFLTVHDFHFSLWAKGRPKAIFMSPNLDNCSYTCGKFSPSRPGVIYLCKSNGEIDTWDLLDESHKPSVKDTLIKEKITSINIFRYNIPIDENAEIQTQTSIEYMVVGDISGQMTLIEVPKLFSEVVSDEKNIMKNFLDNEIQRQEYMEVRMKKIEEDQGVKEEAEHEPENDAEKEVEYKYAEEAYLIERKKIAEELGIELPKTPEELEKERKEKEKKEQEEEK